MIQLTQIFIDSIVASVQDAPIEFRRLFKILHEELKVSMGEYQATVRILIFFNYQWNPFFFRYLSKKKIQNLATSILFLRFFCPAIVKPVEHRIIDQIVPEKVPDLIMVTKVLQTLANFTKFGKKEENMKELNPFIDSNLDKLRKFFEEFVDLVNFIIFLDIIIYVYFSFLFFSFFWKKLWIIINFNLYLLGWWIKRVRVKY